MTIRPRTLLPAAALVAGCAAGGVLLWRSTLPPDLRVPELDPRGLFGPAELARADRYERGVLLIALLGIVVELAVLAFMAWRGPRFVRGVPLGPIGVGIVVGLLTMLAVWGASIPFTVAATWWDRRYDVSELGYAEAVLLPYAELGTLTVVALVAIVVVMWLARKAPTWWWVAAAPAFAGLAAAFAFVLPYLLTAGVERADRGALGARIDALETATGAGDTPVFVEDVSGWTDAPNAYAVGIGPSSRVVLWDTLLLGSTPAEVDFVVAHELGHVARDHVWKGIAWFAILALPSLLAVHLATRPRGGLGEARNVPLAALVVACVGLCLAPAQNAISRHFEREADWIGLEATRDPQAAERFFVELTETVLADPTPPSWSQALFGSHPSDLERIAMARAWSERAATARSPRRPAARRRLRTGRARCARARSSRTPRGRRPPSRR